MMTVLVRRRKPRIRRERRPNQQIEPRRNLRRRRDNLAAAVHMLVEAILGYPLACCVWLRTPLLRASLFVP